MIQPNTGTLSNQQIGFLHIGQCEGGDIRLSPFGSRYTTTFKKLPTQPPNTAANITIIQ